MNLITYTAHEVFPKIWVIYCIAAFGWSTGSVGLTLALVGIVSAINQATMVRPVVAKLGERRTLLASLVVAVAGLALLGVNNGYVFLVAAIDHRVADVSGLVASVDDAPRETRRNKASCRARSARCAASRC